MKWTLLLGPFDLEIVKQRQVKISKIRVSKLHTSGPRYSEIHCKFFAVDVIYKNSKFIANR